MKRRKWKLVLIDACIFVGIFAFYAMYQAIERHGIVAELDHYIAGGCVMLAVMLCVRLVGGIYTSLWRYPNADIYFKTVIIDIISGLIILSLNHISYFKIISFWDSTALVALFDIATICSRLVYQLYHRYLNRKSNPLTDKIPVAIVGAGQLGTMLVDELKYSSTLQYNPVCFVDVNPEKVGNTCSGIKVFAENEAVYNILKGLAVQEVIIAISNLTSQRAQEIHEFYSRINLHVKIYDFPIKPNVKASSSKRVLREINIEDLLFRDSVNIASERSKEFYTDKIVLVTGGGGSIGSEICRQIAKTRPKKLIIFDIYENNAYDIQQELVRRYGSTLDLAVEIGSVRDRTRLEAVFAYYKPEIVFHAAAHKHVPLMEHSNCEPIKNNIMGTYNTADMAEKYGVKKFVLISTDKAVNPTNIMGASKRMCEMIVQCRTDSQTCFTAVRFGNVLGSNGSVIPLFKRQIEEGGPITITDKRIIRYFMTIPEASALVMQAGSMARKGELFVLDMGKPIKILDLAENIIRLAGLKPYTDIDIKEIGLRPGEKLFEELLVKSEDLYKTDNDRIFIENDKPLTRLQVEQKLEILAKAVETAKNEIESPTIKNAMKQVVPTFVEPESVNVSAVNYVSEQYRIIDSVQMKKVQ